MKSILLATLLFAGCATAPQGKSYTVADLDAAIAIAQKHSDMGPLSCYQALKTALALSVAGPLSAYEAQRVSLPQLKLACLPVSLP